MKFAPQGDVFHVKHRSIRLSQGEEVYGRRGKTQTTDKSELLLAWETVSPEVTYYLDLETGEIVMITEEAEAYLEEPLDESEPDWMEEMLQQARQVKEEYGPSLSPHPQTGFPRGLPGYGGLYRHRSGPATPGPVVACC